MIPYAYHAAYQGLLRPIRPAAKRSPHRYADYRGTQSALKSAFFQHPASASRV
jgi:hypothetical protein